MSANIPVKPSTDSTAVPVKTDVITGEHVPIYKLMLGGIGEEDRLLSYNQPLPIEYKELLEVNKNILKQLERMNARFKEWGGDQLDV